MVYFCNYSIMRNGLNKVNLTMNSGEICPHLLSLVDPFTYTSVTAPRGLSLDPGSEFFHPGSKRLRIRIKKFKYFLPKKLLLRSWKNYLGCSSRIRIFFTSHIQGSKNHRIPDPDLHHWLSQKLSGTIHKFPVLQCFRGHRDHLHESIRRPAVLDATHTKNSLFFIWNISYRSKMVKCVTKTEI